MLPVKHNARVRFLSPSRPVPPGPVLYWMQASVRTHCNHALEYALHLANHRGAPLEVVFVLTPGFPGATRRHYRFLIQGLMDVAAALKERRISFSLVPGNPPVVVADLAASASTVVTDQGYLRIQREWRTAVVQTTSVPVVQVESNVVVPVEAASDKDQWAAATLRPRIHRLLDEYLVPLSPQETGISDRGAEQLKGAIPIPRDTAEVETLLDSLGVIDPGVESASAPVRGGQNEAERHLKDFLATGLHRYDELRNDPGLDRTSRLSPYLHFGHISPIEIALSARSHADQYIPPEEQGGLQAFLEELIVRRELAMNFAHYNDNYDSWGGIPEWARTSLLEHSGDERPRIYTAGQLERAETDDPYWNACQRQMVRTGRMHGYMRMYWGKKILEWMQNPQDAFALACELNDRYQLDGRDPNGYAGVAWCFGKHDRPWVERPIFGKIRYMNANGLKRKFKQIDSYVAAWAE